MQKIITLCTLISAGVAYATPYTITENVKCKPESDVCETTVKIFKDGIEIADIPGLEGPAIHSSVNSQILSCESNSVFATEGIRVFDYSGKELFSYPHSGYQRDCGVLTDGALYWLLYNIVENGRPKNSLIVLNAEGNEVFKSGATELTEFIFFYKNEQHKLTVPTPDWPG